MLAKIQANLRACRACPKMCGKPVHGPAVDTRILLVGQAPGVHEERLGRPFAFTAGKTLFKWLHEATGLDEAALRERIYFSAVARCFPGKAKNGKGDRAPSAEEIRRCGVHLAAEVRALEPTLVIAVGKLAIAEVLGAKSVNLVDVVGRSIPATFHGTEVEVIPLPHPSGVSRWPNSPVGKRLLAEALKLVAPHLAP